MTALNVAWGGVTCYHYYGERDDGGDSGGGNTAVVVVVGCGNGDDVMVVMVMVAIVARVVYVGVYFVLFSSYLTFILHTVVLFSVLNFWLFDCHDQSTAIRSPSSFSVILFSFPFSQYLS